MWWQMNQVEFNNWLSLNGTSKKVGSDICSRVKRIELELNIDIDDEYKKDKCESIINKFKDKGIRLVETNLPYGKYTISTYKHSLKKYISFIESNTL